MRLKLLKVLSDNRYIADPEDILSVEDERRLLGIAHRLQANAIVLRLGKHILKRISPLACLSICAEFDLDGLLSTALVDVRAGYASMSARAASNGAVTETSTRPSAQADSGVGMLADAFADVVLDFDVKLPFEDPEWPLSASWRIRLATAREQVSAARRVALDSWINGYRHNNFGGMEAYQVLHIPQTVRTASGFQKLWDEKINTGT